MKNKTWGGRFSKGLDPRVNSFNASLSFDYALYDVDITGSIAHAKMLAKQGLITAEEADIMIKNLEDIRSDIKAGKLLPDDSEDIHMFVEKHLTDRTGDIGKKLHTGRSRNDQVALDLRLYAKNAALDIQTLLKDLIATLSMLSEKHQDDMVPGYTHLQQAQPVSLGVYFGAYQNMFTRDLSRLEDWLERMNYSPLGAGALAGSRLPLDRSFTAELLGFKGYIDNTLDSVSDRDYIVEFCSFASIVMMHLSRISEDLIIWATQEFNFLSLDDAFATGSSLMPNKKNPDVPELMRGKTGRVFGHLMAILTVMKALPLAYNKDMQEDKEGFFDTITTVHQCLELMSPFLQSITFHTDVMGQAANSGFLGATAALEDLVTEGMAFRDAHHQVGEWVKQAIKQNRPFNEVVKEHKGNET